jgi:hypothetical protein
MTVGQHMTKRRVVFHLAASHEPGIDETLGGMGSREIRVWCEQV